MKNFLTIFFIAFFALGFNLYSQGLGIDITGNFMVNQCETNEYSILLTNNTGNDVTNIVVVGQLENLTGFTYVGSSSLLNINSGGDNAVNNPTVNGIYAGDCTAPGTPNLTWDINDLNGSPVTLANGETIEVKFELETDCDAVSGSFNTLIDYENDGTPVCDNTGLLNIMVFPGAVTIKKTPNVVAAELGDDVTWDIEVENTGIGYIENVIITDELGVGMTYLSSTGSGQNAGQITTWSSTEVPALASMAPGDKVTVTITADVTECENLDNKADVRFGCDATTDCFNTADDGGTARASIQRIVRNPLIEFDPPDISFDYCEDYVDVSFTVSNVGDGTAFDVCSEIDFSPLRVSNVSAGCVYNETEKCFEITNPIAPSGNYALSFRLNNDNWCDAFQSKALLWQKLYKDECDNLFYPPVELSQLNPPNNAGALSVSVSGAGGVIQIGDEVTYTVTSSYSGPETCGTSTIGLVTVENTVPDGFTVTDADGGTWVDDGSGTGGTVTWTYQPTATLSKTLVLQAPLIAECETYCYTTFTNSVEATVTDCCDCELSASSSETTAIECEEGLTSEKTSSPSSTERCTDITFTNTYTFGGSSPLLLSDLLFLEDADNDMEYVDNLTIELDGSDVSTGVIVTDNTPGGKLELDFSGASSTSLAGTELIISYDLSTENSTTACGSSTFYSWSCLNIGSQSGSNCYASNGLVHEATQVTVGSPTMSVSITGLPEILDKCDTETVTITLTQTSSYNPKDVKLVLSGLNYYATNPGSANCTGDVSPVSCTPSIVSDDYVWTFNDAFTSNGDAATITLDVQKRCTGIGDLILTAYYDDKCTDDASIDELCNVSASDAPTILLSGDLLIEKTPETYYATTNQVEWVIYITNRGTGTANNVWLDDELGAGLDFVSVNVVGSYSGTTTTTDQDHDANAINGVTVGFDEIGPGVRHEIRIIADVIACDNLTNVATTSFGCIGVDCQVPVSDNSIVNIPTQKLINSNTIVPSGDLQACSSPTGSIILKNSGQTTCYNLESNLILPTGMLYVPGSTRWRIDAGSWNGPNASYNPNSLTSPLQWTETEISSFASLDPGQFIEIEYDLEIACDYTGGNIDLSTSYKNPCSQVFSTSISRFSSGYLAPVVEITKTRADEPIYCDETVTWEIEVTNTSGYTLPILWLEDTVGDGFDNISSDGDDTYCSDNGTITGQVVAFEVIDLPHNASATFTVTADEDGTCDEDLNNTVKAWWGCGTADGDSDTKPGVDSPDDGLCLNSVEVTASRDETREPTVGYVDFAIDPTSINACDDATEVTIVFSNTGPTNANDLDFVITLPEGLSYNTGTAEGILGTDDSGTPVGIVDPTIDGDDLVFGDLTSSATDLIDVLQADGGDDTYVLQFELASNCYVTDDVELLLYFYDCCGLEQYSTDDTQEITALEPDIVVTKTPVNQSVDCGTAASWTITVTNNGDGNAEVVRVEDTFGDWLDYEVGSFTTTVSGATISNIGGSTYAWEFNNLAANTSETFSLEATLNPDGSPQDDCSAALRQNNVCAFWGCGTTGDAVDNDPVTTDYDCSYTASDCSPVATVRIPDLIANNITANITCDGDDGIFNGSVIVRVRNTGTSTAGTFTVSVTDGTWTGTGESSTPLPINTNRNITIDASGWNLDCNSCAAYALVATVDADEEICECNETNNTYNENFTPQLPDLKINYITPSCSDDGLLDVTVNIENDGCGNTTGAFTLRLEDNQGHSANQNVTGLVQGANTDIEFSDWLSQTTPATVEFYATVDFTNTNCECTANNSFTYSFDNPYPDISVSDITPLIECDSDGNFSGTVSVEITNIGNGPITSSDDFLINIDDGEGWTSQHYFNANLSGTLPINVGASVTVDIPWNRTFVTDPFTCSYPNIEVAVDGDHDVCESTNASNTFTTSYSYATPNLRISSITPSCVSDGVASIDVVVNNNGCGTITDAVVRLEDNDGNSVDETVTFSLASSGTTGIVTFSPWVFDGDPVSVSFSATVDPGELICELDGDDNTNTAPYSNANLQLVSMTPSCSNGTYWVSMVIRNSGTAAINNNFAIRLDDNDSRSSTQNFTNIGGTLSFNANTQQTVVFNNWVVDGDPAIVEFSGTVDYDEDICEVTNIDNSSTVTFETQDIAAISIAPTITCLDDGDFDASMVVSIDNVTDNPIDIDFVIAVEDGESWSDQSYYNADLGGTLPIAANSSSSVTIDWDRDFSAQPAVCNFPNIACTVDFNNEICELSDVNNTASATEELTFPNLRVSSITPSCVSDGVASIDVVVNNNGCGTITDAVVRLEDNDGNSVDETVTFSLASSGTTGIVTFSPWTFDGDPASVSFSATVDPGELICELKGDDNTNTASYSNANLQLVSMTPSCNNGTYWVSMILRNNGTSAINNDFTIRLDDNDSHTSTQNFTNIGGTLSFNANTQQTVVFNNWVVDGDPATVNFNATVDYDEDICEVTNSDNSSTVSLEVFDIRAVSIAPTITCVDDGDFDASMVVSVENTGANPINIDFVIALEDDEGWSDQSYYHADLGGTFPIPANTTQTVTIDWDRDFSALPAVCNFPNIACTVDYLNEICELTDANNTASASDQFTSPNLRITSITPSCVSDGVASIDVVVNNNGCGTITDAVVRLEDNDGNIDDETVTFSPATSGTSGTVTFSDWPVDGNPASVAFSATVDPGELICEIDGDDNTNTSNYSIPNLQIISMTPSCNNGAYGVSMVIRNSGTAAINNNFAIRLDDNDSHTSTLNFTDNNVNFTGGTLPINAGTQQTVVFNNWVVDGDPATVEFSATVDYTADDSGVICESNHSDNTNTASLAISDLVTVSVVPELNCVNDGDFDASMVVTLSNIGDNPITDDFLIRVSDGEGWTDELLYAANLGGSLPIEINTSPTVTFDWDRDFTTVPPTVCSFPNIGCTIDPLNTVCEVTNANNTASANIQFAYPNLLIDDMIITCSGDGDFSIDVIVVNNGCVAANNVVVRLQDNDGNSQDQTVNLAVGTPETLTFAPWPSDGDPTPLVFTATIDPDGSICEIYGSDNSVSETYLLPNLQLLDISITQNNNGTYKVHITIANSGSFNISTDFKIRLTDSESHSRESYFNSELGGILPFNYGNYQIVTFDNWTILNPRAIKFTAELDSDNDICEGNTIDNNETIAIVPTLTEWAAIAFGLMLLILGGWYIRKMV